MKTRDIEPFLKQLASLAASQTLPLFRNLDTVENKNSVGFDPVTLADQNAERAIREKIMATFPDHGIEGEEFGTHNREAEYCWVIDPIDGTRAFIAGIPVWGTLIALCHNGKPVAGIMSQPFTGELFISDGTSSWFERTGQRRKINTRKEARLDQAILMTTAPEPFSAEDMRKFASLGEQTKMIRYGADCYAYCMLAAGQIDLVVEAGLSFYDIAALIPIIENAGGVITNWGGETCPQGGRIIAAGSRELHEEALKALGA